jgi:chromosome segregation ATPase
MNISETTALRSALEDSEASANALKDEVKCLRNEIDSLRVDNSDLAEAKSNLEINLLTANTKLSENDLKSSALQIEVERLKKAEAELGKRLEDSDNQINSLVEERTFLNSNLEKLKEANHEAKERKISELSSETASLKLKVTLLENENVLVKERLKLESEKLFNSEKNLKTNDSEYEKLQTDVKDLQSQSIQIQSQLLKTEVERNKLMEERLELSNKLVCLFYLKI